MKRARCPRPTMPMPSGFTGFRFPPEVILLAVRWYLRYGLSYRPRGSRRRPARRPGGTAGRARRRGRPCDALPVGAAVHTAVDRSRPPHASPAGDRWFVDETYVKVNGIWSYVYRAVDQHGQVIDVYVSPRRDIPRARRFFTVALRSHGNPGEVITDRAPASRT